MGSKQVAKIERIRFFYSCTIQILKKYLTNPHSYSTYPTKILYPCSLLLSLRIVGFL